MAGAPFTALAAAAPKPRVRIETPSGVIVVELEDKKAPITAANFLRYVDAKKYDGGTIYRASRTPGVKGAGTIQGGPSPKARKFRPIAHESTRTTGLQAQGRDHLAWAATSPDRRQRPTSSSAPAPSPTSTPTLAQPGDNQGYAAFGTSGRRHGRW